ncbi:ABC-type transport auxiliary lipoprotein family protein [Parvibaculum sp.]|uniref:ABC-type transport auxiliary lipoprotein family protein n=1 Tax=Parvibaculum sp. TaxID=2024848 RepID=UPI00272FD617|nr:ABC-type transport auxiliary lipoprotein family protein [Parvibaculum sp.]MDP1627068.1 ABC-type transport auxiliary lipoprotein family protein [Parvibaculum sp.]MDP2149341.1 ABC-type transport auxiliary lipoprotein family protein [Parvibaculum sp.]MDP3326810.1 ABC-type transport auxiliary lipoprotein family protein [Parvibaculum sp.]
MKATIGKLARFALLSAAFAPLGACALADVASGPAPSLYVLTAPAVELPATARATQAQLVVEEFSAPAAIDTGRIVFQPSPNEIKYYAGARWSDRAPSMIASLLVETLTDTGRFPAVIGPGNRVRADLALVGDIRTFAAYKPESAGFGEGVAKVRVVLFVRLVNVRDRSIVAAREFSAEAQSTGIGMEGIVGGYDAALDTVLSEIAVWTFEQSLTALPREAAPSS